MKLVADVRNWWKWHSTHALALLFGLPVAWWSVPQMHDTLPPRIVMVVEPALAVLAFVGRIRDQQIRARGAQPDHRESP